MPDSTRRYRIVLRQSLDAPRCTAKQNTFAAAIADA